MRLYLYCLMSEMPASLPISSGVQDQSPRILEMESLYLVVSDFVGGELAATKKNIVAHESVIESCMDPATPLPFRFGAVVSWEKLQDFMQRNALALKADLGNVQDCVEMGLKVMFPRVEPETPLSGTAFLNAKRRQQDLAAATALWVGAAVPDLVRQTNSSLMAGGKSSIVRIAHLVERCHLSEYKSHLDTLVRQRTDVGFLRSGPWPPYSFISTTSVG